MDTLVPNIYYWEERNILGGLDLMTMGFKWEGKMYCRAFEMANERNVVKIKMARRKLFQIMKESLDVLVHHGAKVLDATGNINPRLVNDEEAIRYKFDPLWDKRVAAFNKIVRVKEITKEEADKIFL